MASHLIDARGTVEPNVDPEGVESRLRDGVFLWLDIDSPDEDDFALLRDVFKLHPLALEDARKFGQRPKIEDYDDFTALVVFGAADDPTRRSGARADRGALLLLARSGWSPCTRASAGLRGAPEADAKRL